MMNEQLGRGITQLYTMPQSTRRSKSFHAPGDKAAGTISSWSARSYNPFEGDPARGYHPETSFRRERQGERAQSSERSSLSYKDKAQTPGATLHTVPSPRKSLLREPASATISKTIAIREPSSSLAPADVDKLEPKTVTFSFPPEMEQKPDRRPLRSKSSERTATFERESVKTPVPKGQPTPPPRRSRESSSLTSANEHNFPSTVPSQPKSGRTQSQPQRSPHVPSPTTVPSQSPSGQSQSQHQRPPHALTENNSPSTVPPQPKSGHTQSQPQRPHHSLSPATVPPQPQFGQQQSQYQRQPHVDNVEVVIRGPKESNSIEGEVENNKKDVSVKIDDHNEENIQVGKDQRPNKSEEAERKDNTKVKSHSEKQQSDGHQYQQSGQVKTLLQAARKCDFTTVRQLLDEFKSLKLVATDELGKTALHYAASSGEMDLVKEFLARQAPIDKTDKMGQTSLHYAASKGHIEIIQFLIKEGASINHPDTQHGRTALHFAVSRNQVETVDYLVYCGADISAKDKEGNTPASLCTDKRLKILLANYQNVSEGNEIGEIPLESVEVQDGSRVFLNKIGLSIECNNGRGEVFNIMCRRHTAEFNDVNFGMESEEEFVSDIFVYRIGQSAPSVMATVTIPIFCEPHRDEELLVRTNKRHSIMVRKIHYQDKEWKCTIIDDLKMFSSFVVVCRPKKEIFNVGKQTTTLRSSLDSRVELEFPDNAFETSVNVGLQIIQPPPPNVLAHTGFDDILSLTSFYSVDAGGNLPLQSVHFKVPLPSNYSKEGMMVVLSRDVKEEDNDEAEFWDVIDMGREVGDGRLMFEVTSFSVKVGVQSQMNFESESELKLQVEKLYQKALLKEFSVTFITMTKRIGETNTFKVLIECCLIESFEYRRKLWLEDGFLDQRSSTDTAFKVCSKTSFKIGVSDSVLVTSASSQILLQFHPKRDNYQCFVVKLKDDRAKTTGHVFITQVLPHEGGEKILTSVAIEFQKETQENRKRTGVETNDRKKENERKNKPGLPDVETVDADDGMIVPALPDSAFTDNAFMKELLEDLDDEWYKIFILMGIAFTEIDDLLSEKGNLDTKLNKLILKWRDASRRRDDLGIPIILSAARKGGRRDISNTIQIKLKRWFEVQPNTDDVFYRWVERAYEDSDILVPGDYPRPMSDSYLVLLSEELTPNSELGETLGISRSEINESIGSKYLDADGLKVMKMLTTFRENVSDNVEGLDNLILALETLNLDSARDYAVMCARAWCRRTADHNDEYKLKLDNLLRDMT